MLRLSMYLHLNDEIFTELLHVSGSRRPRQLVNGVTITKEASNTNMAVLKKSQVNRMPE